MVLSRGEVLPGVQVMIYQANGYRMGTVEKVDLEAGTVVRHTYELDADTDMVVQVLPNLVERVYGEVLLCCDTPERVAEYEARAAGWKRVSVVLAADYVRRSSEQFDACQAAKEEGRDLAQVVRGFLRVPAAVLKDIDAENYERLCATQLARQQEA